MLPLEEPVSGSIEGMKETVGILVSEFTKDFNVRHRKKAKKTVFFLDNL